MALATRCPSCHALFRVVADQLKLRGGLVRCGACGHAFDAIGTLSYVDDASLRPAARPSTDVERESSAPMTLRFAPGATPSERVMAEETEVPTAREVAIGESASEEAPATTPSVLTQSVLLESGSSAEPPVEKEMSEPPPVAETTTETVTETVPASAVQIDERDELRADLAEPEPASITEEGREDAPASESAPAESADAPATVELEPAFLQQSIKPRRKGLAAMLAIGSVFLAAALLVQLAVHFRSELIVQWPATRPTLMRVCQALDCSVGWPTRGDLLAVVGSELQAVPGTSVLELTAVVRSRASFTLALPAVEVTLTDTQNRAIARKVFAPADYLAAIGSGSARIDEGIGPGSDLTIRVIFEARGVSAAGFVVYPFYL